MALGLSVCLPARACCAQLHRSCCLTLDFGTKEAGPRHIPPSTKTLVFRSWLSPCRSLWLSLLCTSLCHTLSHHLHANSPSFEGKKTEASEQQRHQFCQRLEAFGVCSKQWNRHSEGCHRAPRRSKTVALSPKHIQPSMVRVLRFSLVKP